MRVAACSCAIVIAMTLTWDLVCCPVIARAQGSRIVRLPEQALRRKATKTVIPQVPSGLTRELRTGVVVSEIEVSETGDVTRVKVLESPGPLTERAVAEALVQWKFRPLRVGGFEGEPSKVVGKLTFYYTYVRGNVVVQAPTDAGYVGRWPRKLKSRANPVSQNGKLDH